MSAPELTSTEILGLAERQAVYRCFADDGTLLYIGTTGHLGRRLADHAQKTWFLASTRITLEWFPDEEKAAKAERKAIETEGPKYNIAHNRAMTVRLPSFANRKSREKAAGREVPIVFLTAGTRPEGTVTLREALAAGLLPGYASTGAVRTAKYRNPAMFPEVAHTRRMEKLYDGEALRAWALATKQKDGGQEGCPPEEEVPTCLF